MYCLLPVEIQSNRCVLLFCCLFCLTVLFPGSKFGGVLMGLRRIPGSFMKFSGVFNWSVLKLFLNIAEPPWNNPNLRKRLFKTPLVCSRGFQKRSRFRFWGISEAVQETPGCLRGVPGGIRDTPGSFIGIAGICRGFQRCSRGFLDASRVFQRVSGSSRMLKRCCKGVPERFPGV